MSAAEAESFNQAFAEWSAQGRGSRACLRPIDLRPFLAQVGVALSASQCRSLWNDFVTHPEAGMGYQAATDAYLQVSRGSVSFRIQPERELILKEEARWTSFEPCPAAHTADAEYLSELELRASKLLDSPATSADVQLDEAREILVDGGLSLKAVESFLEPFQT
eukprot:CAMPEP_0178456478 /NCGR_PEP_ID=MMETSP0689_2-20121128/46497_1 /TAXON_ID=160604 /ORGANISM="Amphidinium massartii, Strain CS-259" /LENGTH=163 /DNA_ID=CAMNT_0020082649 /DNA_START=143 /DNA_END=630 /DNA_ORIENTATION=-